MKTKKEIIRINDFYYARYKKWYHLRWRYVCVSHSFLSPPAFLFDRTFKEAKNRLNFFFNETSEIHEA